MNAICLVIDRLHVGQVGAYGNAWIETPSLDALACESLVFDQALVSSPTIEGLCQNVWQGRHPLLGRGDAGPAGCLARRLAEGGIVTVLATDEPAVACDPLAQGFGELLTLERPEWIEPADEVDTTHLARCFTRLVDWLGSAEGPFLLWVHLSSLGKCWDAPYEFRERCVEPGDPAPPGGAEVPWLTLPEDFDPDTLLGIAQSYAAQVSLADVCLGALLESLDEGPLGRETLLAVLSARGFPLGEHGRVGAWDETLHGELVHVPMMLRFPDRLGAAGRSQALVTPADLRPTLLDWWSLDRGAPGTLGASLMPIARGEVETVRDRLLLGASGAETAIRTPAWYMRLLDSPQLYAKPDDRWEVNDVANRCPGVVEELQAAADDFRRCLEAGRLDQVRAMSEVLHAGLG